MQFALKTMLVWLFVPVYMVQALETLPERRTDCEELLNGSREVESQYQKAFQAQIDNDLQFLQKMQEQAVPEYLSLRAEAQKEIASGLEDFGFAPHRAIVERIAGDAKQRQTRKFGEKYRVRLESIHQKALSLLSHRNPPYKATIRFVMFEYLPLMDEILAERWPDKRLLKNHYHRHHAEHLVEKFLAGAPDFFMFFSFEYTNDMFFVDTRPALMNLIGLNLQGLDDESEPPYGDKHYMLISEFAWHDWGHADFTAFRDLTYILTGGKPIDRVVWEWEVTRRKIKDVVAQVRLRDADLAEAMEQIEFEFLRERGFQFSLTVFKQELETPKWTEVLQRKLAAGFYSHGGGTNLKKFERLEEARKLLLRAVERMKEMSQLKWIRAVGNMVGEDQEVAVPGRIIYTPALGYTNTAKLDFMEILDVDKVNVHSRNVEAVVPIGELISAQVDPTKHSPFKNPGVLLKIQELLWLKNWNKPVLVQGTEKFVQAIRVMANKHIYVVMTTGEVVSLADVSYDSSIIVLDVIPAVPNLEIFKMEQVLGTEERGEAMAFSIRPPTQTFVGTLELETDLITGHYMAHITTVDGQKLSLPLMQLRIDPLNDKSKDL